MSGASAVAGRWSGLSGWQKILCAAGVGAVVLGLILWPGLFGAGAPSQQSQDQAQRRIRGTNPEAFVQPQAVADTLPGTTAEKETAAAVPVHRKARPQAIAAYEAPWVSAGAGSGIGARRTGSTDTGETSPGTATAAAADGGQYGQDALGKQLAGATDLATMHASVMAHPDYMIMPGNGGLPCLATGNYNTVGGFVSCRTDHWLRGHSQRRGLLPPGTIIAGQVRNGLEQGQLRMGVLFTSITTGDMTIPLRAPAGDEVGRSGLEGNLQTFFWETAGAVALYAGIDAVQQGLTGAAQYGLSQALTGGGRNGGSYTSFNLNSGSQSLAQQQLQSRLNRQPQMDFDRGLPLIVQLGQPLDFYAACKQRQKYDQMACPLLSQ